MAEQTPELQEIPTRLKRAERQLGRLAWITSALFAVTGASLLAAGYLWLTGPRPVVATSVAAKEFLLFDDQGHVRATLRQHDGHPLLGLRGQDDRVLTVGQIGGRLGLRIAEADGEDRLFVGTQPDFQGFGVWDAHHIERDVFGIVNNIEDVTLRKADGKIAFQQP